MKDTDILKDKTILIVEDDEFIAKKEKELLQACTENEIQIANCIDKAFEIIKNNTVFDIVIVDVMMPKNKENYLEILEIEKKLAIIRDEFDQLDLLEQNDETKRKILDKRIERSQFLKIIDGLIEKDGGITLINRINNEIASQKPKSYIFLTAVGNEEMIKHGKNLAGLNSKWLVKPVPDRTIIESCCTILENPKN